MIFLCKLLFFCPCVETIGFYSKAQLELATPFLIRYLFQRLEDICGCSIFRLMPENLPYAADRMTFHVHHISQNVC